MDHQGTISFSVPSHFDNELISELLCIGNEFDKNRIIKEVYGCLSNSPIGHGRNRDVVAKIESLVLISKFRDFAVSNGLNFVYLMNAPFVEGRIDKKIIKDYISDIIEIVNPHALAVSSLFLMRIIREISSEINIYVSTIAGVKKPEHLKPFLDFNPRIVVPHHDIGRDLSGLEKLKYYTDRVGVTIQLLVNESCIYACPDRENHYELLSLGKNDNVFQKNCNEKKCKNPIELLGAGWIRPEDIDYFVETFGITCFKISGREKSKNWIPDVVKAYMHGKYDGNLIRILAITPPWSSDPCDDFYINNRSLETFIENLPSKDADKIKYYTYWYNMLRTTNDFEIRIK